MEERHKEDAGRSGTSRICLVGGTVYTGDRHAPPVVDALVMINGNTIEYVGDKEGGKAYLEQKGENVTMIDTNGKYIVPGLIDTHVHYSQTGWVDGRPDCEDLRDKGYPYESVLEDLKNRPDRFHLAFLSCGVTSVFDVGGYPWTTEIARGTADNPLAPHMKVAGPLLATWMPDVYLQENMPSDRKFIYMKDEEDVKKHVKINAEMGVHAIKFWFIDNEDRTMEEMGKLVAVAATEAKRYNLPLLVHATGYKEALLSAKAGCDVLVHSVDDQELDEEFLKLLVEKKIFYCPTLIVDDGYHQVYRREPSNQLLKEELPCVCCSVRQRILETTKLPTKLTENMRVRYALYFATKQGTMWRNLKFAQDAGVKVIMGTDAGNPLTVHGPSVFKEMDRMQSAGLTPLEVLESATKNSAEAFMEPKLGMIKAGYLADLVIVRENPAEDIAALRSVDGIIKRGHYHTHSNLTEILSKLP